MSAAAPEHRDIHTYVRRRRIAAAVAVVACPLMLGAILAAGFSSTDEPVKPAPQAAPDASDTTTQRTSTGELPGLDAELDRAKAHHELSGTYAGYPSSLPHAANSQTVVVSLGSGPACTYAGIVDGVRTDAVSDPTGAACESSQVAALQVELDRQDGTRRVSTGARAPDSLDKAARLAARASARNFVGGRPSFLGVDRLPVDGVTIVPGDQRITLRTTTGPCYEQVVLATGEASEATPC